MVRKSVFNRFFDKIFVISLYDKFDRWKKVEKQFAEKNIKVDRFIAIDGRCKKEGEKACEAKLKTFEIMYNVRISNHDNYKNHDNCKNHGNCQNHDNSQNHDNCKNHDNCQNHDNCKNHDNYKKL